MKYTRFSIRFSLILLTLVGLMSVALAAWLPGKGVKWAEYWGTTDPVDRYIATTVDGVSAYTDSATGLSWATDNQTSTTWTSALSHCTSLGGEWRLPHRDELLSLVNADMYNPATSLPSAVSAYYWSSTEYAGNTSNAWRVSLDHGYVNNFSKTNSYQVVCVHD